MPDERTGRLDIVAATLLDCSFMITAETRENFLTEFQREDMRRIAGDLLMLSHTIATLQRRNGTIRGNL